MLSRWLPTRRQPLATCVRSKVDAAAFAFPITEACGLKAGRPTDLGRFSGAKWRARLFYELRRGRVVIGILGGILHKDQVCQNSAPGTIRNLWKNNAEAYA